mmetsp:Transcript_19096/g.33630  ORF Transcript_19096/g.33630 Transcript_19096/m.33630 type:complete len:110 (+) Transcript_19096:164-493(+)
MLEATWNHGRPTYFRSSGVPESYGAHFTPAIPGHSKLQIGKTFNWQPHVFRNCSTWHLQRAVLQPRDQKYMLAKRMLPTHNFFTVSQNSAVPDVHKTHPRCHTWLSFML